MRSDDVIADRYRLVELIGSGGMGLVWLAVDQREQREVALKRPHAGGGRIRADLEREADIARRVDHPNAIEVFDVVGDGDDCWLVMEYFPSTSLAAMGVVPATEVAAIGAQVAGALAAAHAADVVHRDVTPGNILVGVDGVAKVTDFGISAWRAATITSSGKISGTAAYVSPEVADGDGAKAPSDVFSLGASLFAAVEGAPPYGSGDPDVILTRIRAGRGEPMTKAGPLEPVLNALLQRDRAARPTAAQAADLLNQAAAGQTVPVWTPEPAHRKSRKRVFVAGAAAAVVAVLVLAVLRPWEADGSDSNMVLGDPRTADPCAFADPKVLAEFGEPAVDANYGGLNRCDVLIDVRRGDEPIDVEFQFDRAEPGTRAPSMVVRHSPDRGDEDCDVAFTLTDGNVLDVSAKIDGTAPTDLCEVATAAADHAEGVLREHDEVPRRAAPDARSLANVDACGLITAADLATVPAFADATAEPGFANWTCRWQSPADLGSLQVIFDRNDPDNARDGIREDVAGREIYVEDGGYGEGTCVAKVFHLGYRDEFGDPHVELALVVAEGGPDLCEVAGTFATPVAERLPKL